MTSGRPGENAADRVFIMLLIFVLWFATCGRDALRPPDRSFEQYLEQLCGELESLYASPKSREVLARLLDEDSNEARFGEDHSIVRARLTGAEHVTKEFTNGLRQLEPSPGAEEFHQIWIETYESFAQAFADTGVALRAAEDELAFEDVLNEFRAEFRALRERLDNEGPESALSRALERRFAAFQADDDCGAP